MRFARHIAALFLLATLVACGAADEDLQDPVVPIGEFLLGHTIVVADNAQMAPPSRRATADELEAAMKLAIENRFGRYEGTQYYHIAVSIEGYSLAVPGVPLLFNPKSVMLITATVWDDAAGGKINEEPHQITVLERLSGQTALSSGLTQTREEQLANLSNNAARLIENWMRENPEWFEAREGAAVQPLPDDAPQPEAAPGQ